MKNTKIRLLAYSALFAASIYVMTMVSIPAGAGYVHIGDSLIMLVSSLLPTPYAIIASVVGATLSDFTLGYVIYIPFTAVIKAIISLCLSYKQNKILCKHNLLALFAVLFITPCGYYISECIITGSFIAPVVSIIPNTIQAVASIIIYLIVSAALDKFNIKRFLHIH